MSKRAEDQIQCFVPLSNPSKPDKEPRNESKISIQILAERAKFDIDAAAISLIWTCRGVTRTYCDSYGLAKVKRLGWQGIRTAICSLEQLKGINIK